MTRIEYENEIVGRSHRARTALVALGLAALAAACTASAGSPEEKKEAAPTVRVETIARTDIAEVLTYVADLRAYIDVKIFSPVPDRILYFPWTDGQEIQKGERIALIRREGIERGLEQVIAQMEALEVQVQNLGKELERSKELLAAGVITRQTFDQIQTSYLSTLAQRKALEASKAQVAVTAGNAVITAPVTGVIAGKMLETGDLAVPQMPLCRVLAVDKLKATLRLIEADVAKVRVGQEVELRLDAYPGRAFVGRITNIMPYLEAGTRTNSVEVAVDNPVDAGRGARLLKPGMFGEARIIVDMREGVLAAPNQALMLDNRVLEQQQEGEALRKAFVVDAENVAKERVVKLGARKGHLVEIVQGLDLGERIIVRGQHRLKDGQKVEIVEAAQL